MTNSETRGGIMFLERHKRSVEPVKRSRDSDRWNGAFPWGHVERHTLVPKHE